MVARAAGPLVRVATLVALVTLSGLGMARAQQRPSFAGEWVVADTAGRRSSVASQGDASFRTGTMGSGWGSPITITQDSARFIVQYPYFVAYDLQPPIRLVFGLDGSGSENSVMIGHAASLLRSRASWQGDTLVIVTSYPGPERDGAAAEVRQALALESPETLIVVTTRAGMRGSPATVVRTVYTKR